jgi:hypothetical protein
MARGVVIRDCNSTGTGTGKLCNLHLDGDADAGASRTHSRRHRQALGRRCEAQSAARKLGCQISSRGLLLGAELLQQYASVTCHTDTETDTHSLIHRRHSNRDIGTGHIITEKGTIMKFSACLIAPCVLKRGDTQPYSHHRNNTLRYGHVISNRSRIHKPDEGTAYNQI